LLTDLTYYKNMSKCALTIIPVVIVDTTGIHNSVTEKLLQTLGLETRIIELI